MNKPPSPIDDERRHLVLAATATAAAAFAAAPCAAAAQAPTPGPAMLASRPLQRSPGRPGDFAFLNGHWRIHNLRPKAGAWEAFAAEASCFGILGGLCSVEELRIPQRNFSGMGLRVLDVKQSLWHDHWVNAASGVVGSPGLPGSFEQGAGIFEAEETVDGRVVTYRSVWDLITERSCRWQQASSADGGRSWELNWHMEWTRVS